MYKKVFSATPVGVCSQLVTIEIDISYGLLQWHIVGLADAAIKESRQRVAAALKNAGVKIPDRKIVINLAPADLKKEGSSFDLPIALGILLAAGIISLSPEYLEETLWLGELALDGALHSVKGILPIACDAKKLGKKRIVLPYQNAHEAGCIEDLEILPLKTLQDLIHYFSGRGFPPVVPARLIKDEYKEKELDFKEVRGQEGAKRALQIAASGRHNIMLVGAPGSGKTMLAERIETILPAMSKEQQIEVSKIYSVAGLLQKADGLITQRPFRAPHHSVSPAGLLGGGSIPRPGEISFAHQGILFLDEFLEFKRGVLEQLRQPLEKHVVTISRAQMSIEYKASFLLVAAMNPCPCGYYGDQRKKCTCSLHIIDKYLQKMSGPLLDRMDLQVGIQSLAYENLEQKDVLSSADLKEGVLRALAMQKQRFRGNEMCNAHMSPLQVEEHCTCSSAAADMLKLLFTQKMLSLRSYHKLLKVARTIADLEGAEKIQEAHVCEAGMYRALDTLLGQHRYLA